MVSIGARIRRVVRVVYSSRLRWVTAGAVAAGSGMPGASSPSTAAGR